MKQRNIALCIIFSIITCGIYQLYWLVCLTDDANELARSQKYASGLMVLLLNIITCGIYGLYWAYQMGEKLDIAAQNRGVNPKGNGVLYLIIQLFFPIVTFALVQNEINNFNNHSWNNTMY